MSERRHPNVLNRDEAKVDAMQHGEKFSVSIRNLGRAAGGRGVGCTHYEVPPGKTAFPRHWHGATEEAIYVLAGQGDLRIGEATVQLRAGDYVALPPGPDHVHQLLATGSANLEYLALSNAVTAEVVGYPDSKKIGVAATSGPGQKPWIRSLYADTSDVGYWDGE
jgi:uncharacterized cupin superfamily protein